MAKQPSKQEPQGNGNGRVANLQNAIEALAKADDLEWTIAAWKALREARRSLTQLLSKIERGPA
jgi:hypothetical protein